MFQNCGYFKTLSIRHLPYFVFRFMSTHFGLLNAKLFIPIIPYILQKQYIKNTTKGVVLAFLECVFLKIICNYVFARAKPYLRVIHVGLKHQDFFGLQFYVSYKLEILHGYIFWIDSSKLRVFQNLINKAFALFFLLMVAIG
jgi:hypothetical protein